MYGKKAALVFRKTRVLATERHVWRDIMISQFILANPLFGCAFFYSQRNKCIIYVRNMNYFPLVAEWKELVCLLFTSTSSIIVILFRFYGANIHFANIMIAQNGHCSKHPEANRLNFSFPSTVLPWKQPFHLGKTAQKRAVCWRLNFVQVFKRNMLHLAFIQINHHMSERLQRNGKYCAWTKKWKWRTCAHLP